MARHVIFMPSTTSYYTEICRLARTLPPVDPAEYRPAGASSLAWSTTNATLAGQMRRLGALVVTHEEDEPR